MSWASKFEKVQVARSEDDSENASLLVGLGDIGDNLQNGLSGLWSSLGVQSPSGTEKKHDGDIESGGKSAPSPSGGGWGSFAGAFKSEETERPVLGMSYTQRFRAFVTMNLLGIMFLAMAFAVGLPVIVIRPAKFAISFTAGSLMFMLGFAVLKGPWTHLKSMCKREVAPFSALYVGSMVGTLYASLVARSYVLVMLMSGAQLCALAYYMVAGIPGGARGMSIFMTAMRKTIGAICYPVYIACKACVRSATGL